MQTQYERNEGGDDKWYCATVLCVYDSGKAKLRYDDGDYWTGDGAWIYLLPPGHPGLAGKVAMGSTTQAGPAGMVQSVAGPPVVMAMPAVGAPVVMSPPQGAGMGVLTAIATAPGGHTMTVNDPR